MLGQPLSSLTYVAVTDKQTKSSARDTGIFPETFNLAGIGGLLRF